MREQDEYNAVHIAGSLHIPLNTCNPNAIPHDSGKRIVFQCKKGKRGDMACQACSSSMPEDTIWNLTGGIDAWIEAGLPVVRG